MSAIGKGNLLWPDQNFFQPGSCVVKESLQALSLGTTADLRDTGTLPLEGLCYDHLATGMTLCQPSGLQRALQYI